MIEFCDGVFFAIKCIGILFAIMLNIIAFHWVKERI